MPRNVRNFWIEVEVDGKRTRIATGPRAADGGFSMTISQRRKGNVMKAAVITGDWTPDGNLTLAVSLATSESHTALDFVGAVTTER